MVIVMTELSIPADQVDGDSVEEIAESLQERVSPETYRVGNRTYDEIMNIKAALVGELMRSSAVPDSQAKHFVCESVANLVIVSRVLMEEILTKKATNERIRMMPGIHSNIKRHLEALGIGIMTDALWEQVMEDQRGSTEDDF